ncbi:alpha/beta hydrolase [Agrococcus sp. ARC_14]|uniref:alpha/beta fold hydrolase n=1 Tax=Agrococcus sp. ARC_14 TaxID=2919927 RepID=UPI001F05A165|nr:alpha/beta hydrolase [Agrococcus sp. ARC_14]MCH1882670.1 alpha/beta hydrolase [Agrococcus sp. ARC_14]
MDAARHTIELPSGPVSYLEWRPAAPAGASDVLLLHGGGLDSAWLSWGDLGARLAAAGHRVIAPDAPGYGKSARAPWPATHANLVAYVETFAQAMQLERYAVGGLSMGGGMTLGHVLAHPERVTGAILIGSFGIMPRQGTGWRSHPWHLLAWAMTHTGLMGVTMRAYAGRPQALARSLRGIIRDERQITPALVDAVAAEAASGSGLTAFDQWQRDQIRFGRVRDDYSDRLHAFPRPALVVHGERDSGVPVALARQAAARMPDARYVEAPDAGHWTQRDAPDLVTSAITDFLDALAAREPED